MVEPVPTPDEYDDWELEDAIGLNKAEHVGMKWRLQDLQESCRAKKGKGF